jgi:hypothetical protein
MKRLIIATMLALVPVTALANAASYSAAMNKADISCLKPYRGLKHLTQPEKNTFTTCVNHAEITDLEKYEPSVVSALSIQFGNEIEHSMISHFNPPSGNPASCVVTVHLAPDGKITGIALRSSTGAKNFNRYAERFVKEVGKFHVPAGLPYNIYKTVYITLSRHTPAPAIKPSLCSGPVINAYLRKNFDNWAQYSDRSYKYVHTMAGMQNLTTRPHTIACEAWVMKKGRYTGYWVKADARIWVHHKPGTDMYYTRVSGLN